ncbi:MAG: DUF1311 domain-containing protein [Chitinispirillaceae bacterium]|nr:DUF1311 domain-containing protein [Chitinispirillaceae bacterium]
MKIIIHTVVFPLVIVSANAFCQEPCKEADTLLALSECLENQCCTQDSVLNATYKTVFKKISSVYKSKPSEALVIRDSLKKMQKQWIVTRDQHCQFVSRIATIDTPSTGSQLHQATFTDIGCKTEYTKERIRQLKEILTSLNNR